jgi:hypothetical protein
MLVETQSMGNVYEQAIAPARQVLAESEALQVVLAKDVAPDRLLAFLLHFCALGVAMTEPVESWIRRAGERCLSTGYVKLGHALIGHARHEAGHDALMRADAHALAALWNRRTIERRADPVALLSLGESSGVKRYRDLHEETIGGPAPYAQIAIEYEIERLSVDYGPRLVHNCLARIGQEVFNCLSFVHEHVALDEGHTSFNRNRLSEFLDGEPSACDRLVTSGTEALRAYGQYLQDCLRLGDALASKV